MSVEFPPTRVGRRSRRIDPVVPAFVVIAAIVGIAVAKPWGGEASEPVRPTTTVVPAIVEPSAAIALDLDQIRLAIQPHDAWGIRAIVDRPTGLVEIWAPAIGGTGSGNVTAALLPDGPIVALGATSPVTADVRAVRIWRERGDRLEWLTADPPLVRSEAAGLLVLPPADGPETLAWAPGAYRFDLLVGGSIQRIRAAIPNARGEVPPGEIPLGRPGGMARDLIGVRETDPSIVRTGLFATMDGRGVALRSVPGGDMDEAAAWSAAVWADHGSAPPVAIVTLPRATGLGVMLTVRAEVQAASIRRLAPGPLTAPSVQLGGVSSMRGQIPYVAFEVADGGAIEPGVYALSVDWTDETGEHAGTWHVELRPEA